jgi:hypothetical protein
MVWSMVDRPWSARVEVDDLVQSRSIGWVTGHASPVTNDHRVKIQTPFE